MILKPILNPIILLVLFTLIGTGMTLITLRQPKINRNKWLIRCAMVFILMILCFRPSLAGGLSQGGITNLDVTYLVDTTSSMAAEDFDGNKTRLSGVVKDIENITENLVGARFSVIYFTSKGYLALPYTTDTNAVSSQARTLNQEVTTYAKGSSIDAPIDLVKQQLIEAEKNSPERSRTIIYFGDGEQTVETSPKSFEPLKKYIDGGLVLGYGTAAGGKMKEYSDYLTKQENKYIKDYSQSKYPTPDAISKIDEKNLKNIATQLGVKYEQRTQNTDTASLVKALNTDKLIKKAKDVAGSTDLYWLIVMPLGLLMLFEANRILKLYSEIKTGKKHE